MPANAPAPEAPTAEESLNPLFNKTYTTVRLTPLYHGDEALLNNAALAGHAQRLRDQLRGEIIRGVRVEDHGHGDEELGRAGKLLDVNWILLAANIGPWQEAEPSGSSNGDVAENPIRGIFMELVYEKVTYTAMMLSDPPAAVTTEEGFTTLPLLLTRMPPALRSRLLKYLDSTFDTHSSVLAPTSAFVSSTLENYLSHLPNIVTKDIVLTFSFPSPATPSLKTMTITISNSDVPDFVARGKKLVASTPISPPPETLGKRKRPPRLAQPVFPGPFLRAVSYYATSHLAVPISHPEIQLSRVACAEYMLGSEGKVKIFAPVAPRKRGQEINEEALEEAAFASMELLDALTEHAADPKRVIAEDDADNSVVAESSVVAENGDEDDRPAKRKG